MLRLEVHNYFEHLDGLSISPRNDYCFAYGPYRVCNGGRRVYALRDWVRMLFLQLAIVQQKIQQIYYPKQWILVGCTKLLIRWHGLVHLHVFS